jgi:hypothetical protein
MDRKERQAIEAAQTLTHLHDIADLLAERMRHLPHAEAEVLLDQELVRLAVLAKRLEAKSDDEVEINLPAGALDSNAPRLTRFALSRPQQPDAHSQLAEVQDAELAVERNRVPIVAKASRQWRYRTRGHSLYAA